MATAVTTARSSNSTSTNARVGLVATGAGALIMEHFIPYGAMLLYPFTLMATWVHEMGHGLAAIALGGQFDHLEIYRNASGLAWTTSTPGLHAALVAAAGLVAPPLAGSLILAFTRGPKRGGTVLLVLSIAMALSLLLWVRSAVGILTIAPMAAILAGFALWGGSTRQLMAQLVGVLFALDTLSRIDYLFMSSAVIGGVQRQSDIAAVAAGMGGPQILWALAICAFDLVFLALGLKAAWR
jgi:Peptidase M50B-like